MVKIESLLRITPLSSQCVITEKPVPAFKELLWSLKDSSPLTPMPRTERGQPVTAGIKGQLQKHYTKTSVPLIALTSVNRISK